MRKAHWKALIGDRRGMSALKFVLTACVLALIALSTTEEFRDHALLKAPLHELRSYLPETLTTITDALSG